MLNKYTKNDSYFVEFYSWNVELFIRKVSKIGRTDTWIEENLTIKYDKANDIDNFWMENCKFNSLNAI